MADGLDNLIRGLERLSASGRAGILDDEENASKLLWAEYGTVTAPARPTVSAAVAKHEERVMQGVAASVDHAIAAAVSGAVVSGEAIVGDAADDLAAAIVAQIDSNTPPPLAESTLAGRRSRGNPSDATLVDTGAMRGAVRSETKPGARGWPE